MFTLLHPLLDLCGHKCQYTTDAHLFSRAEYAFRDFPADVFQHGGSRCTASSTNGCAGWASGQEAECAPYCASGNLSSGIDQSAYSGRFVGRGFLCGHRCVQVMGHNASAEGRAC